jgi:hypothetical protein
LRKAVPLWWQTFRWWRRVWNGGAEVAEITVKKLLCCRFRRTGKVMGQVYQYWWWMCREVNVFPRFEYHIFYVLYSFVTSLLILPRTYTIICLEWRIIRLPEYWPHLLGHSVYLYRTIFCLIFVLSCKTKLIHNTPS